MKKGIRKQKTDRKVKVNFKELTHRLRHETNGDKINNMTSEPSDSSLRKYKQPNKQHPRARPETEALAFSSNIETKSPSVQKSSASEETASVAQPVKMRNAVSLSLEALKQHGKKSALIKLILFFSEYRYIVYKSWDHNTKTICKHFILALVLIVFNTGCKVYLKADFSSHLLSLFCGDIIVLSIIIKGNALLKFIKEITEVIRKIFSKWPNDVL